jgi:cation diffusion facilitator CzcD-associated flavoprotein CzcO
MHFYKLSAAIDLAANRLSGALAGKQHRRCGAGWEHRLNEAGIDIAIIGAGPYGLSLAAHLRECSRSFRIFGTPMGFWVNHMPEGMCLKSEGFASSLYDPDSQFTLGAFCRQNRIPYADVGLPVRLDLFIDYARAFQQRYVPQLEQVDIARVVRSGERFRLTTTTGEELLAGQVVVAAGIKHFAYLPPEVSAVTDGLLTHSSEHHDLTRFAGRQVVVLGAGASAFDLADLLAKAGAAVQIVARRSRIDYNEPPSEHRTLLQRLKAPRSGLGTGWRSRMCSDMPLVFHAMPQRLRLRAVKHHLGPAPCWFTRDSIAARVPVHVGATLASVACADDRVQLTVRADSRQQQIEADHIIAATGYRVALSRLKFIDPSVLQAVRRVDDTPVLDRHFESSVPGLYFVGSAAANSFGPLLRFAYGAKFAARRMAARLMG